MNTYFTIYTAIWVSTCIAAIIVLIKERKNFVICRREYRRFLLRPWKVTTFTIALTGMVFIAPYTGDPTWDYVDGAFMSLLTFLTAPWVVGTIYNTLKTRSDFKEVFVATCAWMFTASWSYDIYVFLRYGYYPETWLPNIFASSVLYISAGLLWNLEWEHGRGTQFAFMNPNWPAQSGNHHFGKVLLFALPFMILVSILILSFVWTF